MISATSSRAFSTMGGTFPHEGAGQDKEAVSHVHFSSDSADLS